MGQSRKLLDRGFFPAAEACLGGCGHRFRTKNEKQVEKGGSKVDYVGLVGDKPVVLIEAKSPTVMKRMADSLPEGVLRLKWGREQLLVPKVLQKVSTRVLGCNTDFDDSCNFIGRFISRSEKDGMAFSHVPQLLDRLSSHQRRRQTFSRLFAKL